MIQNKFASNPRTNAVTIDGEARVFLGDHTFFEASMLDRLRFDESTDTAGVIAHEFFHVAGLSEKQVTALSDEIQKHCGRPELLLK